MGMYQWTSKIGYTSIEDLKNGLQNLTGLKDIIIGNKRIHKKGFSSTFDGIWIEDQEIFILEPLGGPMLNKYLDCSFFYLLKQKGFPTKRKLPKWAGRKWQDVKYVPWVRIRK